MTRAVEVAIVLLCACLLGAAANLVLIGIERTARCIEAGDTCTLQEQP